MHRQLKGRRGGAQNVIKAFMQDLRCTQSVLFDLEKRGQFATIDPENRNCSKVWKMSNTFLRCNARCIFSHLSFLFRQAKKCTSRLLYRKCTEGKNPRWVRVKKDKSGRLGYFRPFFQNTTTYQQM